MGALSGKVIIVIIACVSVVVIATIVIPIVVIYSEGESTKKSTTTTSTGGSTMNSPYSSTSSTGGCNSEWIDDNFCDDINNNMDCSYDGGDCCASCGDVVNTLFCSACTCLDPNGTICSPTTPNPGNVCSIKFLSKYNTYTLQMFTGIYRDSAGGFLQYLQGKPCNIYRL